jgi:hypothetical protein
LFAAAIIDGIIAEFTTEGVVINKLTLARLSLHRISYPL